MASKPVATASSAAHRDLEAELRRTVERYELIFRATNDVLYDLDLITATVVWNDALYSQFGYSRSEPANTLEWWTAHIHPDDALLVERQISQALESRDETYSFEYRFRKADGHYGFVRDRGFILRDPQGEPQRIIGSFLDITQQKRLDKAKDEFISLVSHQLRTPLTVIRIYGEMFTNGYLGDLSPVQTSNIKRITNASIRLIKLVGSILDVTKLELNRFAIQPDLLQVNDVLAESIDNVMMLADEKHVTISFEPDDSLPKIPIDAGVLEQIVHNLLTNAIRYSPAASGRIIVQFERTSKSYKLSVIDNGIGIPSSAKTHIFDRFYRADNAVNVEEQGTGLGLYLAKIMTEAFGGSLTFKSRVGQGTAFFLRIPHSGMQPSRPE